jgi:hypothetical protein
MTVQTRNFPQAGGLPGQVLMLSVFSTVFFSKIEELIFDGFVDSMSFENRLGGTDLFGFAPCGRPALRESAQLV